MSVTEHCGRRLKHIDARHGAGCQCILLSALVHCPSATVRFSYCLHVLQKRWRMTCQHGEVGPVVEVGPAASRWGDLGKLDSVKAVLLSNG